MRSALRRPGVSLGTAVDGASALLRRATPSPQRAAELLLAHVIRKPREYVLAHRSDAFASPPARAFTSLVRRCAEGVPLPYLTGRTDFFGRTFLITPAVLVPRPETEALVESALRFLDEAGEAHPVIADIGTGSGVLAVSLAAEAPRALLLAADRSAAALRVAKRNARRHGVARRIRFIVSDLLTELPDDRPPHLIVANLPYVREDDLRRAGADPETRGLTFEPSAALDGGPDGLFVYRRFFAQLGRQGKSAARRGTDLRCVIVEHAPTQRRALLALAHEVLPNFAPRPVNPFVTRWSPDFS